MNNDSSAVNRLVWSQVDSFVGNYTDSALAEWRPCPICGASRAKTLFERVDFQFFSDSREQPKRLNLREVFCTACGGVFRNPCFTPYGFEILGAEAGRSYGSTEGRPAELICWLEDRSLLRPGTRVFDVGCFEGVFLDRLPSFVIKLGIDIDALAIERGREKFAASGLRLFHGDFETFEWTEPPPDTITMVHVLEHLPRPVEVLKKLRQIAHRDTRLVVEVPILELGPTNDVNSFFSFLHATHFSRNTLEIALSQAGWRILDCTIQTTYNGCRVLAAPDGRPSTPRFVSEDWRSALLVLESWLSSARKVDAMLKAKLISPSCILWGGGAHTESLYQHSTLFEMDPERLFAVVDSDLLKQQKTWRGISIHAPRLLAGVNWDSTQLVVSSYGGQEAIVRAALALEVPRERILTLYESVRVH